MLSNSSHFLIQILSFLLDAGPDSSSGGPISSRSTPHTPAQVVANSQVAVSITRGACLPPNSNAGAQPGPIHGRQVPPGVVNIPIQHNRSQPSQPPVGCFWGGFSINELGYRTLITKDNSFRFQPPYSHGETTLDRFHRQATANSVNPYPLPTNRQQPTRRLSI